MRLACLTLLALLVSACTAAAPPAPKPPSVPIPTPTAVASPTRVAPPTPAPTTVPTATATRPPSTALPTATARPAAIPTAEDRGYEPCQPGQLKGNRSSNIYHAPGQRDYERTYANVTCFNTVAEAERAGFRAAQR